MTEIRDSLEYYWVVSSDENKLVLPEEYLIISSPFRKKVGDSEHIDCQLRLYKKAIYLLDAKEVIIGLLNFSFELTFELVLKNSEEEDEITRIKKGDFSSLKFEKDDCDCEFEAVNQKDYQLWKSHLGNILTQKNFYSYYEVKRVIGSGANASVVIAENKLDGKQYAVKSLSKAHIYQTEYGKAEIESELDLMRQIDHENVMRLFEVFDADSSVKIVLELVSGGQLLDAIKQNPNLTWHQIGKIMKQILSGLESIHSKNIMHRDLKPENILMRNKEDVNLVIADFGLSTRADQTKYLYLKCGTPGYVAPEVINLKDNETHYETKCDIFSAGAIFYRLCVHKPLFSGVTHAEVLQENKQLKFSLETQQVKELPPLAQDLLSLLLQVDPKKRISAKDALNHKFFQYVLENERKDQSPFKGDIEKARKLLKEEKKRNSEIMENSPLKMRQSLITGKLKPVLPQPSVNKRGSFTGSILNLQQAITCSTSLRGSNGQAKDRKPSLDSIDEEQGKTKKVQDKDGDAKSKGKVPSQQTIPKNELPERKSTVPRRATISMHQLNPSSNLKGDDKTSVTSGVGKVVIKTQQSMQVGKK